jgi:hypothetical protein
MALFRRRTSNPEQPASSPAAIEQSNTQTPEERYYIADAETVAAVKMETSALTPEQDEIVRSKASGLKERILNTYSSDIQPEALKVMKDIEDRVVVMDTTTFNDFNEAWGQYRLTEDNTLGVHHLPGGIIALNNPATAWQTLPDSQKGDIVRRYDGDERAAREAIMEIAFTDTITHEILHGLQDHTLPRTFLEIATNYYQYSVTSNNSEAVLRSKHSIPVFDKVVGKYGISSVRDVYFGAPMDPHLREKIVNAVTREARKYPELIEKNDHVL